MRNICVIIVFISFWGVDFLHPETMRYVYDTIQFENQPDLIRFPQNALFFVGNLSYNINFVTNNIFNRHCGEISNWEHHNYVALETPGVCNKIWRRDFIGDTTFPITKWEDYPFSTPLFGKANHIFFLPKGGYYYCHYITANNTTLNDVKKKSDHILEIFDCCNWLNSDIENLAFFLITNQLFEVIREYVLCNEFVIFFFQQVILL